MPAPNARASTTFSPAGRQDGTRGPADCRGAVRPIGRACGRLGALAVALLLAWLLGWSPTPKAWTDDAAVVSYPAGWNLVAVPTGTELGSAPEAIYALGPRDTGYRSVAADEVVAGRATWIYFNRPTTLTLGKTAAEFTRVIALPGQAVLIGNPSATDTLQLNGADEAFAYDHSRGYIAVTQLAPGQGAFVLRDQSGAITLGKPPDGATADEIARLQTAIAASPFDRPTIERVSAATGDLVRQRRYDQVQSAVDDLRSTQEDAARAQAGVALPGLSQLQALSAAQVRGAIADAAVATLAGNLVAADAAVEAARSAAVAAEDDGIALAARATAAANLAYAGARQVTLNPVAAAGALLRSASLAFSLGVPPRDQLWTLANRLLTPGGSSCDVPGSALALDDEERAMLNLVNMYRAANGLAPLQLDVTLQQSAAWKSANMVQTHNDGHDDGFRSELQRFKDCGYPDSNVYVEENLARGFITAQEMFTQFKNSAVHNTTMLSPLYSAIGVKRAHGPNPNDPSGWTWIMDFGSVVSAPAAAALLLPVTFSALRR